MSRTIDSGVLLVDVEGEPTMPAGAWYVRGGWKYCKLVIDLYWDFSLPHPDRDGGEAMRAMEEVIRRHLMPPKSGRWFCGTGKCIQSVVTLIDNWRNALRDMLRVVKEHVRYYPNPLEPESKELLQIHAKSRKTMEEVVRV